MFRKVITAFAALTMAVSISGCANQNSIFRKNVARGASPTIFTADAKQRHLVVVPGQFQGEGWKVCAEAAPDVFSALSTSAAADLGFSQGGAQTDAQAKAAIAIAEAAATIERTQTINLLRESMYRTCERYLSGAIDRSAFVVQAGRDWRAMIAILAIEQLTRVARPPSTIIAAGSTSANVQSESDVVRQLIIAQGAEEEARIAKQNADAALASSSCATITDANKAECEQKQNAATSAADALARATHKRETWEAITKSYSQGPGSNSSTGTVSNNPGGYASPPSSPGDLAAVSATVAGIVQQAFATDETQLFCIQAVNNGSSPDLTKTCLRYLIDKVEAERRGLFASPSVQARATELSMLMQGTRQRVAQYFSGLDEPTYASQRALLASKVGPFCDGRSRNSCIAAALAGELDPIAEQLAPLIDERIRTGGN